MSILWLYRQQCFKLISHYKPLPIAHIHTKARTSPYVGTTDIYRAIVSDDKVPWTVKWLDYRPTEYTSSKVLRKPSWADEEDARKIKNFNALDGKINRESFMGNYKIDPETNRPMNPQGRTGLSGRGLLGRWGPNHAGDPIVTRWSKNQSDKLEKVLEIVLINRKDNQRLALPGGMVDLGEHILTTVKREFMEEAFDSNPHVVKQIDELFRKTNSVYRGYIDDPRNTDNAWIESEAINIHDETGELTKDLVLQAGDDAAEVKWVRLDRRHSLHASHEYMIQLVIKQHGAYEYWHANVN